MEALVYDDSPIADFLEGDAAPDYEGEVDTSPPTPSPQYAPRGLPRLRDKLRTLRRTAQSVTSASGNRFLERFRYNIIASQLLSEDSKSRSEPAQPPDDQSLPLSLRGASSATALSFAFAWVLHWVQNFIQTVKFATWLEIGVDICFLAFLLALLAYVARKQYLKFTRQTALLATSRLLAASEGLDEAIKEGFRYIQEIEVIARGYGLSNSLPPITRLEGQNAQMQCRELRRLAAKALTAGITHFIHFHNDFQTLVSYEDLRTYYHIYELSPDDFSGAVSFANDMCPDAQETLKQLRFLFQLHSAARRYFLVDLLALRTTSYWSDVRRWRKVAQVVKNLTDDISLATRQLKGALTDDDPDQKSYGSDANLVALATEEQLLTPEKQLSKAQMRRFEGVASGVRALNAKVRIARDEITDLISRDAGDNVVNATIIKHYEAVGSELRSVLEVWDRGRSTMTLLAASTERDNYPLSELRSPMSPSPSLGGLTAVEGGPADALKMLNGEAESESGLDGNEEVFEAVVKPRNRMSVGVNLTREEKIAKLREDRQKRATLQEQTDHTTNMLRELQMVIKHRPLQRQSPRVTSV